VWAEGGVLNTTAGGSRAYRSGSKGYSTVTEQQQGANTYRYRRPQRPSPATKWQYKRQVLCIIS